LSAGAAAPLYALYESLASVQSRGFGPPRDGGNAETSCNIGIVLLALLVLPGE
jgi:hypothetical protein